MIEQPMRVLVIDDEALARQRLCSLLARVPDVEVVGECQNGLEAVAAIRAHEPDEIYWIQARDDLARIHLAEGAYDVREPLSRLEARLPHNRFLRVHRSTIVNTAQVREAQPFDQGDQLLILRNGKRITTGRSYRKAVQEFLKRAT